jgi:hypothetical protein
VKDVGVKEDDESEYGGVLVEESAEEGFVGEAELLTMAELEEEDDDDAGDAWAPWVMARTRVRSWRSWARRTLTMSRRWRRTKKAKRPAPTTAPPSPRRMRGRAKTGRMY